MNEKFPIIQPAPTWTPSVYRLKASQRKTERMQSSLSYSIHGRSCFNFQQSTKPSLGYPARRAKSPNLLIPRLTKSYTLPGSFSSTIQVERRPSFHSKLQQPPRPLNKPTRTPSTTLILRREINDASASAPWLSPIRCGMSSNNDNTSGARSFRNWIELFAETVSTAFPVWVALGCLLGRIKPSSFIWARPKLTVLGITLTMLGMGMTLTLDDLRGALAMPKELTCGFLLQYWVRFCSQFFSLYISFSPEYWMCFVKSPPCQA